MGPVSRTTNVGNTTRSAPKAPSVPIWKHTSGCGLYRSGNPLASLGEGLRKMLGAADIVLRWLFASL